MTIKQRIFAQLLFLGALLLLPTAALADALDDAKRNGEVGEQSDGYLGAVSGSPSAATTALIADINAKRRAVYERVAGENNLQLRDVEVLAGQKAIDKTVPGNYVRVAGAAWRQK